MQPRPPATAARQPKPAVPGSTGRVLWPMTWRIDAKVQRSAGAGHRQEGHHYAP